jgi:outer membrane immunogenic protein
MRRLIAIASITFAAGAWASSAWAADYEPSDFPTLRGSNPYIPAPPTFTRWTGFYVGAQAGYGSARMDFAGATEDLYAYLLRELLLESERHVSQWQVLGSAHPGSWSIGGFFGYNTQWDDVVLGFDVHYSGTNFSGTAPVNPLGRRTSTSNGLIYDVQLGGSATMKIHDWGAARFRAGWTVDNLLPYATIGLAFGRADITRTATVDGTETDPNTSSTVPFFFSSSETRKNTWIYGWAAGGGVDYLITPNIFVRAEYEYVNFTTVAGIKAAISTARVGGALRF